MTSLGLACSMIPLVMGRLVPEVMALYVTGCRLLVVGGRWDDRFLFVPYVGCVNIHVILVQLSSPYGC